MDDDSPRAGTLLERLHRLATIQILGIRDLYKPGHHPRHRPRTIDAAVKAHDIAQFVEYYRALHPDEPKENSVQAAADCYGVERAYVYKARRQVDPERRQVMKAGASASAEWYQSEGRLR